MCPGNKSRRPSLLSDSPRARIRVVVRIRVRVRILRLEAWAWPVDFEMSRPFE